MFESFSRTFAMLKQSYVILRLDKELLLFPISSAICIVSLIGFAGVFVLNDSLRELINWHNFIWYTFFISIYIGIIFSIVFFNAGLIHCANIRINGGDPKFIDGVKSSKKNIYNIFKWSLFSGVVLIALRTLRHLGWIGKIISSIMGALWNFATFLVLPVMILEQKGVGDSLERSILLLKQTWGENIIGQLSFSGVYLILSLLGLFIITLGIGFVEVGIITYVLMMSIGGLLIVTLEEIFKVVLYNYAVSGKITNGFDEEIIKNSFKSK